MKNFKGKLQYTYQENKRKLEYWRGKDLEGLGPAGPQTTPQGQGPTQAGPTQDHIHVATPLLPIEQHTLCTNW